MDKEIKTILNLIDNLKDKQQRQKLMQEIICKLLTEDWDWKDKHKDDALEVIALQDPRITYR